LKKTIKILCFLIATIGIYSIVQYFQLPKLVYVNASLSEPLGIYLVQDGKISVGDYVIFKVPEQAESFIREHHLLPAGTPLLKQVYALPNQHYAVTDNCIYVGNIFIGKVFTTDGEDVPLPKIRGIFTVRENHFLALLTYNDKSLDCRYFGDIPQKLIIAKVRPFLVIPI